MATIETLATFDNTDGSDPSGLQLDANGNLFGTTLDGGADAEPNGVGGYGTAFEIPLTASGYASTPVSLVSFTEEEGVSPTGGVLIDGNGDLFGTLLTNGSSSSGSVYEIANTPTGYANTPEILAAFAGPINPIGPLIADAQGDLIGTAEGGGVYGGGAVFEISKTATGYATAPTVLASFDGADGLSFSTSGLIADASGDLFGQTSTGGGEDAGTVFEIARTATGYASVPIVLASFPRGTSGGGSALTIDAEGDLFGTDAAGASLATDNAVFEIAKSATGYTTGYGDTPPTLVTFSGGAAGYPSSNLLIDAAGDLWGTTTSGFGSGTVFEIIKTSSGYATTPTEIGLQDDDDTTPGGNLIADAKGDLFGASSEGSNGDGAIFEITGSGFVTCFCPGTRILTTRGEVAVEELATDDAIVLAEPGAPALPLRWLGRQTIATRFADPLRVAPIRIRAGALGKNQPHRDLRVSPDHALLVDGVFVQAGALVNGVSILRDDADLPDRIVYFHVELPRHALLLAEGAAAESFIDNVDRLAFDNWEAHEALEDTPAPLREMTHPRAKSHRQVPRALRERLLARACMVDGHGVAAAA